MVETIKAISSMRKEDAEALYPYRRTVISKRCILMIFTGRPLLIEGSATGYLTRQETVKCLTRKR